jgi:hypothetical protein
MDNRFQALRTCRRWPFLLSLHYPCEENMAIAEQHGFIRVYKGVDYCFPTVYFSFLDLRLLGRLLAVHYSIVNT